VKHRIGCVVTWLGVFLIYFIFLFVVWLIVFSMIWLFGGQRLWDTENAFIKTFCLALALTVFTWWVNRKKTSKP
jgi:hypothetical protein